MSFWDKQSLSRQEGFLLSALLLALIFPISNSLTPTGFITLSQLTKCDPLPSSIPFEKKSLISFPKVFLTSTRIIKKTKNRLENHSTQVKKEKLFFQDERLLRTLSTMGSQNGMFSGVVTKECARRMRETILMSHPLVISFSD